MDTVIVRVESGHGPSSSRVLTQILSGVESAAPASKDVDACAKQGRESLIQTWQSDLDLPIMKWETIASIKKVEAKALGIPSSLGEPGRPAPAATEVTP